jgi:toxin ParE1/3/4
MRLEVHSEAREEFLQAVSFYEAQVPGLGSRFITEIERCQKALLETSLIGHPFGRRLRKFTVGDRFPYSIVYAILGEVLFILAYAHGSRRPGYWRARSVR